VPESLHSEVKNPEITSRALHSNPVQSSGGKRGDKVQGSLGSGHQTSRRQVVIARNAGGMGHCQAARSRLEKEFKRTLPLFQLPLLRPPFVVPPRSNRTFFRHNILGLQNMVERGEDLYGTARKRVRWRAREGPRAISPAAKSRTLRDTVPKRGSTGPKRGSTDPNRGQLVERALSSQSVQRVN
jgi:hypothetical protein